MKLNKPSTLPKPVAKEVLYWACVLGVAFYVFMLFVRLTLVGRHDPAFIEKMLAGTQNRPFVYRQLLPMLANFLTPLLPARIALKIGRRSNPFWGDGAFLDLLSGATNPSQVILIFGMMYVSLAGFAVAVWLLLKDFGCLPKVRYITPVVLLFGLRIFMEYGYIYDLTALFLFTLGMLLMARQQWTAYLIAFAAGTLNKETIVLLCVIFFVYYLLSMPWRRFMALSAAQLAIYGLIQGGLRYRFRDNGGADLPWGFESHVEFFRQVGLNTPWILVGWAAAILFIAAMIVYRWRDKPLFLRASLAVLPFFLGLFLYLGYETEIRAIMEVYPILALLMIPPQLIRSRFDKVAVEDQKWRQEKLSQP